MVTANKEIESRIVTKEFKWECGKCAWLVKYVEISESGDTVYKIQIHGYDLPEEPIEHEVDEQEDIDLVAEPLASALVEPGHRDSLQIVGDGDFGETEGLLEALVLAGYFAPPTTVGDRFPCGDAARSLCKLLV